MIQLKIVIILLVILNNSMISAHSSDLPFNEEEFILEIKKMLNVSIPLKSLKKNSRAPQLVDTRGVKPRLIDKISDQTIDPELITLRCILSCENNINIHSQDFTNLWLSIYHLFTTPKEFLYLWYMHQGKFDRKTDSSVNKDIYAKLIKEFKYIHSFNYLDPKESYLKVYGWGQIIQKYPFKNIALAHVCAMRWKDLSPRKAFWLGEFFRYIPKDHWFISHVPSNLLHLVIFFYAYSIHFKVADIHPTTAILSLNSKFAEHMSYLSQKAELYRQANNLGPKDSLIDSSDDELNEMGSFSFVDWFNGTFKEILTGTSN